MVELIWDGKYDKNGKRVAPVRVALPFQTVETVNESAQQRQHAFDLFSTGRDPEWRNRLIWGDKKYVLPALLEEFAGKVDLVYIDPPFATGADFSFQAQVGEETFEKAPSMIEQKAYRDTWGRGYDSYVAWFYETITFLHELLNETGTIYVHCDASVSHFLKLVLDQVFGVENYKNELIWKRFNFHADAKRFGRVTDRVLYYTKSSTFLFSMQKQPFSDEYIQDKFVHIDEKGRRFRLSDLNPPAGRGPVYEFNGVTKAWRFTEEKMRQFDAEGKIYKISKIPQLKRYLDELDGQVVHDLWDDITPVNPMAVERLDYATQKPEALLERIINTSSNPGDLVLDCFCGSGTTAAVAEKLGRRWITCDLGRFAIHTARKRLLAIENVRPFVVQNLGKYERQVWQAAEFGESAESRLRAYRKFILDLYHAEPYEGHVWLHGMKGGRLVHVGTVDAPIAHSDVTAIATEFRRAIGTGPNAPKIAGVDVLGWDFALDANETIRQTAQSAGIDVRFIKIPREVLEKKAVDQGDIRFFELAALSIDVKVVKRSVAIQLTDFMVPPDDVPADVIKAVKTWEAWIDYWAVDWNFRDDTFHNEWQSYRTRKDRSLQLSITHTYTEPGEYTIVVKVIDILGNDTTKAITVRVL
jgi:DNA modification methylase